MRKKFGILVILLFCMFYTACPNLGDDSSGGGSTGNPGGGGNSGVLSDLTGFSASKYEKSGSIEIKFTTVKGAGQYKVYRYSALDENSVLPGTLSYIYGTPEVITEVTLTDTITNTGDYDKAFFYKISYFKNGVESAKSDFVYGICSSDKDMLEPASDNQPASDAVSTVFKDEYDQPFNLILYSYPDGHGGVVTDTDWYKIRCPREMISFNIVTDLASLVNIAAGDVQIEFYYEGVKKLSENIQFPINDCRFGDQPEHYNNETDTGELVDVYFRLIYKNSDVNNKKIIRYKVTNFSY